MIEFEVDVEAEIKKLEEELDDLQKKKAKQIIRTAINKTAVEATKMLARKAQEEYTIKTGGMKDSNGRAFEVKKAKSSKLVAELDSYGKPIELFKFKTSPSKYFPEYVVKGGKVTRGKVRKDHALKPLELDGRMAFIVQFKSGHITLAQRKSKKRFPLKTLYSVSVPHMLGNETDVYGVIAPQLGEILQNHITSELEKVKQKAKAG